MRNIARPNGGLSVLLAVIMLVLSGCSSVPTLELEAYRQNFNTVRTTATDLYLQTDLYAEELANVPTSTSSVTARVQSLTQRKSAIQVRLDALKIINNYNEVLSALATGTDSAAVEGNLNALSTDLKTLKIDELTQGLSAVAPYVAVITQTVGLIDDAIKAKKFEQAVFAAQEPISGILDILKQDADTVHDNIIMARLREEWSSQHFSKIVGLRHEFRAVTKPFNDSLPASLVNEAAIRNIAGLYAAFNKEQATLKPWPKLNALSLVTRGPAGTQTPSPATLVALEGLIRSMNEHVAEANKIRTHLADHEEYIETYKDALEAVKASFVEMKTAIETKRTANVTTFAVKVLELRKAYLKIRKDSAS